MKYVGTNKDCFIEYLVEKIQKLGLFYVYTRAEKFLGTFFRVRFKSRC
jgi:hypothetical protein